MERLQRVLADGGIASRRHAEELILAGRVTVDGEVVRELGTRVDPGRQVVRVDGKLVRWEQRRYIMLNKPDGYITTASDERGRRTVMDLVNVPERVVPVGRLDRHTSGLLLLTNDGELLYRVTHPRFELEKEYETLLDGHPPPEVLQRLRAGIMVDGTKVVPEQVRPLRNEEAGTVLRIVIHEGRNRIVRRMLERVGYPALKLHRTRVGPLSVRGLASGAWRDLTAGELEQLAQALKLEDPRTSAPGPTAPRDTGRGPRPRDSGSDVSPRREQDGARQRPPVRSSRAGGPPRRDGSDDARPARRNGPPSRPDSAPRQRDNRPAPRGGNAPPRQGRTPTDGKPPVSSREAGAGAGTDRQSGPTRRSGPPRQGGAPNKSGPPRSGRPPERNGPPDTGGKPGDGPKKTRGAPSGNTRRSPGPTTGGKSRRPGGPPRRGGPNQQENERRRDRKGPGGRSSDNRNRRPGGGGQEHRGKRGRPSN